MVSGLFRHLLGHEVLGDALGQRIDAAQVIQDLEFQADQFDIAGLRHPDAVKIVGSFTNIYFPVGCFRSVGMGPLPQSLSQVITIPKTSVIYR